MAKAPFRPLPDRNYLLEVLDYQPKTGALTWKVDRGGKAKAGQLAGHWGPTKPARGIPLIRRRLTVKGKTYFSSRLIWMMQTGQDPELLMVDHIDGDTTNEKWANLRLVTPVQSAANRGKNFDTSRPKGAYTYKRPGREHLFRSHITVDGHRYFLGFFPTAEAAGRAYQAAAELLHGEFSCAGAEASQRRLTAA